MNKYVLGLLMAGIATAGFISLSARDSTTAGSPVTASVIAFDARPYDFGDVDIFGGKVRTTYTLKNEGAQDVTITSAATSCMCTEGAIDDLVFGMHGSTGNTVIIPAGGEKVLTATFDPLAHGPEGTGKISRELMLKTNSSETPEIRLRFTGNVVKHSN